MAPNPDTILRYIVAIQFFFTSMVLLTSWLPMSYTVNQICLIILGLWGIVQPEGLMQIELLMIIKGFSIILDIIAIGMYFQIGRLTYQASYPSYFNLSAAFAIMLLMLKPLMLFLLNRVRKDRVGTADAPMFNDWRLNGMNIPGYQPVHAQPTPGYQQFPEQPVPGYQPFPEPTEQHVSTSSPYNGV